MTFFWNTKYTLKNVCNTTVNLDLHCMERRKKFFFFKYLLCSTEDQKKKTVLEWQNFNFSLIIYTNVVFSSGLNYVSLSMQGFITTRFLCMSNILEDKSVGRARQPYSAGFRQMCSSHTVCHFHNLFYFVLTSWR